MSRLINTKLLCLPPPPLKSKTTSSLLTGSLLVGLDRVVEVFALPVPRLAPDLPQALHLGLEVLRGYNVINFNGGQRLQGGNTI